MITSYSGFYYWYSYAMRPCSFVFTVTNNHFQYLYWHAITLNHLYSFGITLNHSLMFYVIHHEILSYLKFISPYQHHTTPNHLHVLIMGDLESFDNKNSTMIFPPVCCEHLAIDHPSLAKKYMHTPFNPLLLFVTIV